MNEQLVERRKVSLAAIFDCAGATVDRVDHKSGDGGFATYYVYCNNGYSCHVFESEFVSTPRVGDLLTDDALKRIESFCDNLGWASRGQVWSPKSEAT